MMYAAIVAASLAVIAIVVFALRHGSVAAALAKSEADRDRLEDELRALAEADESEDKRYAKRLNELLAEQEKLREEIRRRRRPGDARNRLRMLSEAKDEAADNDHQD